MKPLTLGAGQFIVGSYVSVKEMSVNDILWNKSYMNCGNEMKMKIWSSQWRQFIQLRKEAWKNSEIQAWIFSGFLTQLHKLRSLRRSFLHFHKLTLSCRIPFIHNYNKILKSDGLSAVLISALIGWYQSSLSNWTARAIARTWMGFFIFTSRQKKLLEYSVF